MTKPETNYLESFNRAAQRGDISAALDVASKAARHYQTCGDAKFAGIWKREVGIALYWHGEYHKAVLAAEHSVRIQPDQRLRGRSLAFLAAMYCVADRTDASLEAIKGAHEICSLFPKDNILQGVLWNTAAYVSELSGDLDGAIGGWERSAKALSDIKASSRAACPLNNVGCLLAENQQFEPAERYLLSALERVREQPHPHSEAGVLHSLGLLYTSLCRYRDAELCLMKSGDFYARARDKHQSSNVEILFSELCERRHDVKLARRHAERALALATEVNSKQLLLKAHNRLASIESLVPTYLPEPRNFHGLLYANESMQSVIAKLKSVARTSETVLVLGETGTGKELVAQAIHAESPRRNAQFLAFNCTTLSRDMIESRLFGHRKGAFTGADRDHIGIIRAAEGGTLLLDEIGDLSLESQGALLRFLQAHEIQPVGDTKTIKVDTRVIASTNRDLRKDVEAGRFRADLFHRLSVVTLFLPPLWQRRDDIPVLARHFARSVSQQYGKPEPVLDSGEMTRLTDHDWPGNVRELENYIRRRVIFGDTEIQPAEFAAHAAASRTLMFPRMESAGVLTAVLGETIASTDSPTWHAREWALPRNDWDGNAASDFPASGVATGAQSWRSLGEFERRRRLWEALEQTSGNVTRAAELLGISRRAIQKRRRKTKIHEV